MNAFRQLLRSAGGHAPLGTWLVSGSPVVAEAMGCAGFDWCVLDMEHAPLDTMQVLQLLQAVAGTKMVPVLRVPTNDPVVVKRVLDTGATSLLFPMICSADEARRAVAATRYPPQGVRGVGGASRASRFGTTPNYVTSANQQMSVTAQLETPEALAQVDAIADVDGVDAIFIGPADLAATMGLPGQPTHPSVMDAMARAAQRCRAVGKPVGTIGNSVEVVAQYRAAGFDFVAVASDLGLMMRAAQAAVAALRTPGGEHVHTLASGTRSQGA